MLLFIVGALIMFLMGKVTIEQAGAFLAIIVPVLTSIGFIKSADSKTVNDLNNNQYGSI